MKLGTSIDSYLRKFTLVDERTNLHLFGHDEASTRVEEATIDGTLVNRYVNEFWTSRQRQASSIHEISYRACFKPQLPGFFIKLLSDANSLIYDPFSGRGTTVIEAGLLGRRIISNDVNPLSLILTRPRFAPPAVSDVSARLDSIPAKSCDGDEIDLSMFFHEKTIQEILRLRNYLVDRRTAGEEDDIDRWIAMVATNRLTGHSKGFFSVYTLPPNQAVSPERQKKINLARNQTPEYRNVKEIVLKKTAGLLRSLTQEQINNLNNAACSAAFLNNDARNTPKIESDSVQLIVTSPPFLDVVQYSTDNWMRLWFNSLKLNESGASITMAKKVEDWSSFIMFVFKELYRVCKGNGYVAFEVGEVKNRTVNLDEHVVPLGIAAGFECLGILVNSQRFSKTSNIWGVKNMTSGTNSNRIVLFRK